MVETLLEEIETVETEKYDIESLHIFISQQKPQFGLRGSPVFDAKNQPTEIWIESFFPGARLPNVTLMKEIKSLVTEKHHFEK